MPQPPACLLFRSAEVQLLKQTAAVLALACAMDMRAALERVGAAVRQRQASALVQAVSGGRAYGQMGQMGQLLLAHCGHLFVQHRFLLSLHQPPSAAAVLAQAKKPLSVMRTLGTMLLPRLQPGEPDRDFAQGGLRAGG